MITAYILILACSAGLMAFGLQWLCGRFARVAGRPSPLPPGSIALGVTAAMLIVVAAPAWLFALLLLASLVLILAPQHAALVRMAVLVATLPMLTAPLLGATAGLAIDAALIAASMMGETYAA